MTAKNKLFKNPFLLFLPFLLYYVFYVIRHHTDAMIGDESRYYAYAQNLLHGFYSPSPDIYLWNGPGFPIYLMPFVYFKLPLIIITLANAFWQYLSIVFLFKSIQILSNKNKAVLFALFWATAFGAYTHMQSILTESFSYFIVSLFTYYSLLAFRQTKQKYVWYAGFLLGYLSLTKIIFGYIIPVSLLLIMLCHFMNKRKYAYKTALSIGIIAIITALPYLIYTQKLTHKFYYWGNSGGMSLYWMSTPYDYEYGDWNNEDFIANNPAISTPDHQQRLARHHRKEMDEILQYTGVERDAAFKKKAFENIKNNPKKYLKNIYYNLSRMLFNTPNTYAYQKPLKLFWHSSILLIMIVISIGLWLFDRRKKPDEICFLTIISGLYIFFTSLVSADYRLFSLIIPMLLVWIAYILDKHMTIKVV